MYANAPAWPSNWAQQVSRSVAKDVVAGVCVNMAVRITLQGLLVLK